MINQNLLAQKLLRHVDVLKVYRDYNVCYEKQYLNTAILLISGTVHLYRYNKLIRVYNELSFLGLEEFLSNKKYPFRLEIKKGAKIIILSRSIQDEFNLIL